MNRLLAALLLAIAGTAGGCSVPRMIVLHSLAVSHAPATPAGKRVSVEVNPRAGIETPRASVKIATRLSPREAYQFYADHFRAKGLLPTSNLENEKPAPPPSTDEEAVHGYYIFGNGEGRGDYKPIPFFAETVQMRIAAETRGATVNIDIALRSFMDIPSIAAFLPFIPLGEGIILLQPLLGWL